MSVLDILINYHMAFLQGLRVTLELCLVIWSCGIIFGTALGVVSAGYARSWGRFTHGMSFVFSAIPTLVILFWLHYPAQAAFDVVIDPFYTASLTFALVNIFAVGEFVRQAIADFPRQYIVAGQVCGLSHRDLVLRIQLPILFRQLLPPLMVQQVIMLHATLFASLISVEEIFRVSQRINSTIYRPVEIYTALAFFFLLVCLPINLLAAYLKKRYTRDFFGTLMLEARNLTFSYPGKPVFRNIDLEVNPGGITVLIGPSGGGKTTLLRCLALLEPPQGGSIRIDEEVFSYPMPPDKKIAPPWPKLTTVFQQLFLWPHLTLRENIMLPVRRRNKDQVNKDELDELIESFDMGAFIDSYPNEASLGQRQRIALARALMLKPHYLLLDEITSALDVEQIAKILSHLKGLRGQNIGIFIITHLLGFARHAADKVYFMADGAIAESGSPDILRNPQTERLGQFLSVIAAAS